MYESFRSLYNSEKLLSPFECAFAGVFSIVFVTVVLENPIKLSENFIDVTFSQIVKFIEFAESLKRKKMKKKNTFCFCYCRANIFQFQNILGRSPNSCCFYKFKTCKVCCNETNIYVCVYINIYIYTHRNGISVI